MKNLIIIDMQKGFMNEHNNFLINNIQNLISLKIFDNIFATKFVNKQHSLYVECLNWNEMMGGEETNFAISLPKNTNIIEKNTYALPSTCFKNNGVFTFNNVTLSKNDEIYLCGTDYDACVLAIAFQFFDAGFKIKIINNCIATSNKNSKSKEAILDVFKRNFGEDCIE